MDQKIQTIKKISPSKFNILKQCKLRAVLEIQPSPIQEKKINLNTFLGILIHNVSESYLKERWRIDHFEEKWDRIFIRNLNEYGITPDLNTKIKFFLPYYSIKKSQLKNFLKNFKFNSKYELMAEYQIDTSSIFGYIDILEKNENEVIITDLKTGPIFNFKEYKINGIKESYREQLLTYGLAISKKLNYRHDQIFLKLRGLGRDELYSFKADKKHYEQRDLEIKRIINNVNLEIKNGDIKNLAEPNEEICRYCSFSKSCIRLHEELRKNSFYWNTLAILYKINIHFQDIENKINIKTNDGIHSIHSIPNEDFINIKIAIQNEKEVLVTNLFPLQNLKVKKWTTFSVYYIL